MQSISALDTMVIWVIKFIGEGYKIRWFFTLKIDFQCQIWDLFDNSTQAPHRIRIILKPTFKMALEPGKSKFLFFEEMRNQI